MESPTAFPGYTKDGIILLAAASVLTGLSLILYGLRAFSASKKDGKWRKDFIFITIAMIFNIVAFAHIERSLRYGLGHHVADLTYSQVVLTIRFVVFYLFFILISTTMAKFSIIALLIPVQGVNAKPRVYALVAVGVLQFVFAVSLMFLIVTECDPVSRLWDVLGEGSCPRKDFAHKWALTQGGVSALVDFILALWPLSMVPSLKVSLRAKIGFCLLMGLGAITGIASIYRDVVTQQSVNGTDVTFTYVKLLGWSVAEQTGIIILGTIPTLRPLFRKWMGRDNGSSKGQRTQTNMGNPSFIMPKTPLLDGDAASTGEKDGTINVSTTFSVKAVERHIETV
ncbi:hypothetical protein K461DRAFT_297695 [Myriangium duriaei CBS 260.36]|uniref:Rhodopsin domain-containing protein n=1 Tax=Myriangium duriaei CBS 260.36 TaxID=1168546 RepID=A0A9P4MC27_9PEZI|nr:hypothetical protein K461DRAFT_297695 [Myriangium duriaei CBS 260.36]